MVVSLKAHHSKAVFSGTKEKENCPATCLGFLHNTPKIQSNTIQNLAALTTLLMPHLFLLWQYSWKVRDVTNLPNFLYTRAKIKDSFNLMCLCKTTSIHTD